MLRHCAGACWCRVCKVLPCVGDKCVLPPTYGMSSILIQCPRSLSMVPVHAVTFVLTRTPDVPGDGARVVRATAKMATCAVSHILSPIIVTCLPVGKHYF